MTSKEKKKYKAELVELLKEMDGVSGIRKFQMLLELMMDNQAEICNRADVISIDIKKTALDNCNIEYSTVKKSIRLNIIKKKDRTRKNGKRSDLMLMNETINATNEVQALSTIANKVKKTEDDGKESST